MSRIIASCAALAALSLAACSGASTGGSPIPIPTNTPATTIAYAASPLITSQSVAIRPASLQPLASCQANQTPLVLQALDGFLTPSFASARLVLGESVTATQYDVNCKPLPTQAQYAIADATIASSSSQFGLPSPSPGQTIVSGHKHGTTTITATFPDNTTGLIPVAVYDEMGVGCQSFYAGPQTGIVTLGWSAITGRVDTATDACNRGSPTHAPSDVHVDATISALDFPFGYQVVPGDVSSLPGITSCSSFVSQGTQGFYSTTRGQSVIPNLPNPPYVLVFKTSTGDCVKVGVFYAGSSLNAPTIAGLYAVSDASGKFPY